MALMWRVVAQWGGGKIGTGFTNFHFTEGVGTAQAAADSARAFLFSAYGPGQAYMPQAINITFSGSVDVIEPGTGALVTSLSVTAPLPVTGADTGNYAAPAGLCVTWRTAGFVGGHRVRGRTFIVPLGPAGLQNDGTPATAAVTAAQTAAATFLAATPEFVVWHRPESLALGGGSAHVVLGSNVTDRAAMLTSRR